MLHKLYAAGGALRSPASLRHRLPRNRGQGAMALISRRPWPLLFPYPLPTTAVPIRRTAGSGLTVDIVVRELPGVRPYISQSPGTAMSIV